MTQINEQLDQARHHIRERWWVFGLWGVASMILGGYLITRPAVTAVVILQVVSIFLIFVGAVETIGAFLNREELGWGWHLGGGLLAFVIGIMGVANPLRSLGVTAGGIFVLLAIVLTINGLVKIFLGSRQSGIVGRRWTLGSLIIGILQVLVGLFLLEYPLAGTLALVIVFGFLSISGGVFSLVFAFQVRQLPR